MTLPDTLRRFWRIWAVAGLGAVLAFTSSYLVAPTYESSTRLIIHGRDIDVLSSSGGSAVSAPTLLDSGQAKALADTYGSIATSRGLAEAVVDELELDRRDDGTGVLQLFTSAAAWVYRCGRAFVTFGYCAEVDPWERAVAEVQEGTTALQLGTTAGATAGQPGAYVLEVTSSGETGEEAKAVTDAVADELVQTSADLVEQSADTYITRLTSQIEQARQDVEAHAATVTEFEVAHDVSAADQEMVVAATSYDNLRAGLNTARAELADTEARLGSIEDSLAATAPTVSSDQQIDTGRSGTSITTSQSNPVYADLLSERSQAQAALTGLRARIAVLEDQVAAGSPVVLSGTLAELAALQADLAAARDNRDQLTGMLAEARAQAATAGPDLSRLDAAGVPAYPVSPKRYLYLLLGLVLGGLAGAALTWLAGRAGEPDVGGADPDDDDAADPLGTLGFGDTVPGEPAPSADGRTPEQEPVPAGDAPGAAAQPGPVLEGHPNGRPSP